MRKSYSGLEGLVRSQLGHDPLRGDVYLFTSNDRHNAKVFFFEGTGVCIYMKRLWPHSMALAASSALAIPRNPGRGSDASQAVENVVPSRRACASTAPEGT